MKTRHTKIGVATAITITASLLVLMALPTNALAQNECRLDQRQLQQQAGMALGGRVVLGQTFIPSAPGLHVCKVKVHITKNFLGASDLTLHLLRSNFTELDVAVTIPAIDIPMGNSVQVFDFGCNGAALAGMPFYGLKLESPKSPAGSYFWRGSAGNPYVRPGVDVRGWRNNNSGAGPWNALGGWDYAFEIYVCD